MGGGLETWTDDEDSGRQGEVDGGANRNGTVRIEEETKTPPEWAARQDSHLDNPMLRCCVNDVNRARSTQEAR